MQTTRPQRPARRGTPDEFARRPGSAPARAADEQVLDAERWASFARWMLEIEPADGSGPRSRRGRPARPARRGP